jgi:hypothetical protein
MSSDPGRPTVIRSCCVKPSQGVWLLAFVLAQVGCGSVFGSEEVGWFNARLEGAVTNEYRGTGDFSVDWKPEFDRWQFIVGSSSLDSTAPGSFLLGGFGFKRPPAGTYPIRLMSLAEMATPSARGFTAFYSRLNESGDNGEQYVAESGEFTITESSDDMVAGTFHLVGFLICPDPVTGACGQAPSARPPGAPTIDVTGSFEVRPFSIQAEELKPPIVPIP